MAQSQLLVKASGLTFTYIAWRFMKELSIFVDESGDLGEYDYREPHIT